MDWLQFFNTYSIPYVTTGPNVSQGRAAVKCPWCGPEDPSEHLVVNLHSTNWWCWRRRAEHKGRTPEWLIQNLIHCSFDQARVIAGGVALTEDFLNLVQAQLSTGAATIGLQTTGLQLPTEFKQFSGLPSAQPFISYLQHRGFDRERIKTQFTRKYGLRYCTSGPYHGRIIFPVRYNHKIVSWTGRTISGREELRYKALTTDRERAATFENSAPATGPISHYLLWYDRLIKTSNEIICLTEGPFDALKIDELGRKIGVSATCFFTSAPTEPQVNLLHELLPRFKKRFLLLDPDMLPTSLRLSQELASLQVICKMLPRGVEDPGALTNEKQLLRTLW